MYVYLPTFYNRQGPEVTLANHNLVDDFSFPFLTGANLLDLSQMV